MSSSEQQDVGLRRQRLRQRNTLFPATGQGADQGVGRQVKPREDSIHPVAERPAPRSVQRRLQRVEVRDEVCVVRGLRELRRGVMVVGQQPSFRAEALTATAS